MVHFWPKFWIPNGTFHSVLSNNDIVTFKNAHSNFYFLSCVYFSPITHHHRKLNCIFQLELHSSSIINQFHQQECWNQNNPKNKSNHPLFMHLPIYQQFIRIFFQCLVKLGMWCWEDCFGICYCENSFYKIFPWKSIMRGTFSFEFTKYVGKK